MSGVWGLGACQFSLVPGYLVEGRQLGIGNVLHDRTPRLQEDQLALNAGWLKSFPLLDKSGQKWILSGDGLSAFDPKQTLVDFGSRWFVRLLIDPAVTVWHLGDQDKKLIKGFCVELLPRSRPDHKRIGNTS